MDRCLSDVGIRVAVVEPNCVEREYLLALVGGAPGITLTHASGDLAAALPGFEKSRPEMVLADLEGADGRAVAWLQRLHEGLPDTSVLVLSTEMDRDQLFAVLEAGVSGWLQKPCTADQILRAIVILHEGGAVLSGSIARTILEFFYARGNSMGKLSRREQEILCLLDQGIHAGSIGERLGLSGAAVYFHVRDMLLKLRTGSPEKAPPRHRDPLA